MSHLRVGEVPLAAVSAANGTSEGSGSACANPNPPEILLQCVLQRQALESLTRFTTGNSQRIGSCLSCLVLADNGLFMGVMRGVVNV